MIQGIGVVQRILFAFLSMSLFYKHLLFFAIDTKYKISALFLTRPHVIRQIRVKSMFYSTKL